MAKPHTIPSHTYEPTSDKNILRFIDREGNWTHYWIKSKKIFVPAVNHIIRTGYPKGERFYAYLLNATAESADKKLKSAGEEGARTHEAIRDLLGGRGIDMKTRYYNEITARYEPLSYDEWQNLEAFMAWCALYQPHMLMAEHTIWSELHQFAGTFDFIGSILIPGDTKRIFVLLDWKTSGGIWDDYELQVAAYRQAALETVLKKAPIKNLGGLWTGVVRLGTRHKSGFEMKVWNEETSEANFRLFQSVLDIYDKKAGEEFKPEVRNIPSQFAIRIPKLILRKRTHAKSSQKKTQ